MSFEGAEQRSVKPDAAVSQANKQMGVSVDADQAAEAFGEFVASITQLRAPGGCPWDQKQTHESIARNMIEEAYEAVDAIEKHDVRNLREELGDVLLQVVLQSQIAADKGEFDIIQVCEDVNAKIIRRHPHVFGPDAAKQNAQTPEEVLAVWDQIKLREKQAREQTPVNATGTPDASGLSLEQPEPAAVAGHPEGLMDGVPQSFPALMQAYKISRKAVSAGFDWETVDDVWSKVEEECAELKVAAAQNDKQAMELELGDVLFSLVNVARKLGIDAETALRASCNKFRARWSFMEGAAWSKGKRIEQLSFDELQTLWDVAKQHEQEKA